jgi:hypothetical protein
MRLPSGLKEGAKACPLSPVRRALFPSKIEALKTAGGG